jgi:hypothetical protein
MVICGCGWKCMPFLFEQLLHTARPTSIFTILPKSLKVYSEPRNKIWRYFAFTPFQNCRICQADLFFICEIRYYCGSSYEDFYLLECDAV